MTDQTQPGASNPNPLQIVESVLAQINAVVQKLAALKPDAVDVEDMTKKLVAVIQAGLPTKDDGSAFTEDELHAMYLKIAATADDIINRDGGAPASDPDPGDTTGQ